MSPIPQTSVLFGTFFAFSYSKNALNVELQGKKLYSLTNISATSSQRKPRCCHLTHSQVCIGTASFELWSIIGFDKKNPQVLILLIPQIRDKLCKQFELLTF